MVTAIPLPISYVISLTFAATLRLRIHALWAPSLAVRTLPCGLKVGL